MPRFATRRSNGGRGPTPLTGLSPPGADVERRTIPVPEVRAKVKRIWEHHTQKARNFVSVEGTNLDFRGH